MRIVINTTIPIIEGKVYECWDRRYKDVDDDYVLKTDEEFATNLEGLKPMYHLNKIDYKRYRKGLQYFGQVDTAVWDAYADDEKKAIARDNATDFDRVAATLGTLTEEYMAEFDRKSIKTRERRFSKAKSVLLSNVSQLDAFGILGTQSAFSLDANYINHGVEGSTEGDAILGLYDFINATDIAGNDAYGNPWNVFASTGIAALTLTFLPSSSMTTAQELADKMMSFLTKGK